MGANKFLNYIMKKYNKTKMEGKRVELNKLKPGDHFIFPTLYNGLIGELISVDNNATVKWLNHPDRPQGKKEIIAATSEAFKYNL